jgi:hypothetical protein
MTQPISLSINLSIWHLAGLTVLYHAFNKDPLNNEIHTAAKNVIIDSPVIALAGSLTFLVHHFTTQRYPLLSLSPLEGIDGSIKVTAFVTGIFTLKSALSAYIEYVISCKKPKDDPMIIRGAVIHNFLPLALGTVAAYYASFPIKLAQSALYTAGLIGVVKLLGKGYEYANKPDGILGGIKSALIDNLIN